jgi:hypothetical protein
MFDNIINLNKYISPKINENFALVGGGNTTSITDNTKISKKFENNQNINRSMLVESITKLVNNVSSDVIQKNSSTAASAAGSSNTLWLSGVKCDDVVISGVRQGAETQNQTLVKSSQSNMSKISNDISTNIDKIIEKVGSTDVGALQTENNNQLNNFMKDIPGYDPNKAQKLASKCPGDSASLFSTSNNCKANTSYELDASVKQALELDESFKIIDEDDISNDIKTKLEQTNFASCQANASASNQIVIQDITCASMSAATKAQKIQDAFDKGETLSASKRGRLEISDIEQQAVAKLYMTCIFDQKNVSEIANKITNKISKKYNQIYDAVEKKGTIKGQKWLDEKMKLVDVLSATGVEKIMAAAGDLPTTSVAKIPVSSTPVPSTQEVKSVNNTSVLPTLTPSNKPSSVDLNTSALPTLTPDNTGSTGIKFNTPSSKQSIPSSIPTQQTTPQPDAYQPLTQSIQPLTQSIQPEKSHFQLSIKNPYVLYGSISIIIITILVVIILLVSYNSNSDD